MFPPFANPLRSLTKNAGMPEIVCNTTPLQYLHQAGLLHILPALYDRILVPRAVADEIGVGMKACCLPWIASRMRGSGRQRIHGATSLNWRENCDRDEGAQMALILNWGHFLNQ